MKSLKSSTVLRRCLGVSNVSAKKSLFHSLLIDWPKAINEYAVPESVTNADWKTFLKIGFKKERLLKCIDPGICYIVERLFDLGIITTLSCSGHTNDSNSAPYIVMIFPDTKVGKNFISNLRILSKNIQHHLYIQGDYHYIFGTFGPQLPISICLKYRLPIIVSWDIKKMNDANELGLVWTTFMAAIDELDHRGVELIPPELFAETHDDMMQSLIKDVREELEINN